MKTVWQKLPVPLRALLALAVVLGALLALNAWVEGPTFNLYYEAIIVTCGISIVLAVALNIVNGFTGQFSLGHIGFYAVGAYAAATISTFGHDRFFPGLPTDGSSVGIAQGAGPLLALCLVGGLCAALLGFVVGLPSLRLRGDYLAIVTLGFAQIIQIFIRNTHTAGFNGAMAFTGQTRGDTIIHIPHLTNFFWVYAVAALALWVSYSLRFSVHGLAFLAVREDEIAAEAMGINTTKYKVTAFVLSAFFTGVGGALFGLYQSQLSNTQFSWDRSVDTVVMVVLGGLGSISGVAIAAVVLTVAPEALRSADQYRLVIYPLLLVLLMLTRPQGIFGRAELGRDWLRGQVGAVRGLFGGRRGRPAALATGSDVMTTARDREETETTGQK